MTWIEIVATVALLVSIASAVFAFYAPMRAEKFRRESAQKERELNIFSILMSERGRWGTPAMLTALNAVKVIFRDNALILDKWFACYSKAGSPNGNADQYFDLLAAVGAHLGMPMRREDLENFFVNPHEQRETAVRQAQVQRAFSELSANTHPQIIDNSASPKSGPQD
jgi:hypothetical protein